MTRMRDPAVARRRVRAVAGSAAMTVSLVAALTACSDSAPEATLDSAAATQQYQPVVDDLVDALTAAYPAVGWSEDSATRTAENGGRCELALGAQRADPSLPDTAGTWTDVLTVANPVLAEHGFAQVTEADDLVGGWTGISSRDDGGAEMRVADKTYTLLTLSVPVTDTDC